ncbi:MAG TPA: response regulator [Vicinamibacterales bacterium]|jgi:CheY-like chemotaxis protein|nr:response regulator [Vicinamibacterales bacterium]
MTATVPDVEILLVDDDPDDVTLAMRALARQNLANRVHVVGDGAEALAYLRDSARPRLVLLDLKLPKVTGLEVLEQIRNDQRLKTLPVVILTSSREEPDVARAYALGANSYIVKPVDFDQFLRAVSEVGMYWLLINQSPVK